MITETFAPKLSRNEGLKTGSTALSGHIHQSLNDAATDHFSEDDYEFLKFHGVYQQDDRDKRKTGKQYIMMVRTRFPGGVLTGKQYVACDELSTKYGNNTMRVTMRQDFQFHGSLRLIGDLVPDTCQAGDRVEQAAHAGGFRSVQFSLYLLANHVH